MEILSISSMGILDFQLAKISNKPIFSGFDGPHGPIQYPKSPTRSHLSVSRKSKKTEKIEVKCKHFFVVPLKPGILKFLMKIKFYHILHTPNYPKQVKTRKNMFLLARYEFSKSKFHEKIDPRETKF